jgi:membrane protein YqaA with SNARE-associated domain
LKHLIHKITGGVGKLSHWLLSFGPFGLFAIAFLDSVLVPIPGGVDAMLMLLATARPSWMLIYVVAATVGSTAGCVGLYKISQKADTAPSTGFPPASRSG